MQTQRNIQVLNKMVEDMNLAPAIYQPTGPTARIVTDMVEELRTRPLELGSEEGSRLLNTIGAVDYSPIQQIEYTLARQRDHGALDSNDYRVLHATAQVLRRNPNAPLLPYELSLNDLNAAAFRSAALYGQSTRAKPLTSTSAVGFPGSGYTFIIDGKRYSYIFLYYYMRYSQFVDFDSLDAVVEVGCGSGRAVEILKQLHPHLKFYLFDLPPQLYVTQRRLGEAFPGALLPYEVTRDSAFRTADLPGSIATFLPHAIERIKPTGNVLSWNQMVYCIMPPSVVAHYLGILAKIADTIYIVEPMPNRCGKEYGMSETVDYEDYAQFLSHTHENVDRAPAMRALGRMSGGWGEACDTTWKRRPQ